MPDFLALERDNRQWSVIDASVGKGSVRLRKSFTLDLPSDEQLVAEAGVPTAASAAPQLSDAERARLLGGWLQRRLRERKVSTKQVLGCLPREQSVVRQIEVPDVPDSELADIVRLQAETKISSSLEKLLLDFVAVPKKRTDQPAAAGAATQPLPMERTVLMATVPKEFAGRLQSMFKAAELEPVSFGLSSLASLEIVTRADQKRGFSPDETSLVLLRHDNRLEISLLRQRSLLFTHAAQLGVENEGEAIQATLAEVSRSFVALQRMLGGAKLARAWVFGPRDKTQPLCVALKQRLDCDVEPLEPLTELGLKIDEPDPDANNACFAGPLGMLLAASERTVEQLDFLNPRKSVPKMDQRKVRAGIIAAAAATVLIAIGAGSLIWQSSLKNEIAEKQQTLNELNEFNNRGKPAVEAAGIIRLWQMRNLNMLDQTRELNVALPGTDRIYLKNLQFISGRGKREIMRMKADGYAIDRSDVDNLTQQLADMKYVVTPPTTRLSSKDPKYKYHFDLDVEIRQPAGTQATTPARNAPVASR
jgi:Tfp pilus assembly PilM family ATPase